MPTRHRENSIWYVVYIIPAKGLAKVQRFRDEMPETAKKFVVQRERIGALRFGIARLQFVMA
jgi:hypothetical protein